MGAWNSGGPYNGGNCPDWVTNDPDLPDYESCHVFENGVNFQSIRIYGDDLNGIDFQWAAPYKSAGGVS